MLVQRGVGHGLPDDVLKPGVLITGAYPFGLVHGARVEGTGAGVTPLPIGLLFAARSGGHAIWIRSARSVAPGLGSIANPDCYQLIGIRWRSSSTT